MNNLSKIVIIASVIFLVSGSVVIYFAHFHDWYQNDVIIGFEKTPNDYLEFELQLYMIDNATRNSFDGLFGYDTFGRYDNRGTLDFADDTTPEINESEGIVIMHSGVDMFAISAWQVHPDFRNGDGENNYVIGNNVGTYDNYKYLTDNWQKGMNYTRVHGLIGQDYCLNSGSICFDRMEPMILLVHELNPNLKLVPDDILKQNARTSHVERIDSDTVLVKVETNGVMPEFAEDMNVMPQMTLWMKFKFIEKIPCFWDKDPRLCELELKLAEHEKHLKENGN